MPTPRSLSLLICAILSTSAPLPSLAAGWDAAAWPSYEAPRKGAQHAADVFAAIEERGGSTTPPRLWKFQRTNLNNAKGEAEALVADFVAIPAGSSTAAIAAILDDNSGTWPSWTVDDVLAECSLPDNFFDWSPWSGLAGVGGLTNDRANVGHRHGYTNATTAAATTNNLPAGRSTWYSTDYGWQGLRDVLDCLVYKAAGVPTWSGDAYDSGFSGLSSVSWAAAKTATTLGSPSSGGYSAEGYTKGSYTDYGFGDELWETSAHTVDAELSVSVSTGTPLRALAFCYAETITDQGGADGTFDDNGTGLAEDAWAYAGASTASDTETTHAVAVGSSSLPVWCDEPGDAPNKYTAAGYIITDEIALLELSLDYAAD